MHESLIATELVDQAVAAARQRDISRITKIRVNLGRDCHVTGEALSLWFNLAKVGTMADLAVLEIDSGEGNCILMMSIEGEALPARQRSRSQP